MSRQEMSDELKEIKEEIIKRYNLQHQSSRSYDSNGLLWLKLLNLIEALINRNQ